MDKIDSKLDSNKISSITTLTIFSAVVLAFSGGITFEAGMLQGMAAASPYRLVFTIALTGFILFNTIFALLYMVGNPASENESYNESRWSDDSEESIFDYTRKSQVFDYAKNSDYEKVEIFLEET